MEYVCLEGVEPRIGGLQSLQIVIRQEDRPTDFTFLLRLPSLRSLEVSTNGSCGTLTQAGRTLENLTTLTLFYLADNVREIFATLPRCINLAELYISLLIGPRRNEEGIAFLPKVTRLRLEVMHSGGSRSPINILNHLELPSLDTMELHASLDMSPICKRFFRRHPHIKRFIGREIVGPTLEAVFLDLPSVTHLTMSGASNILAFFKSHSGPRISSEWYPLPQLGYFELREANQQTDMRPLLNTFLQWRRGGWRSLQRIVIEYVRGNSRYSSPQDPDGTGTTTSLHAETVRLLGLEGVKVSENIYNTGYHYSVGVRSMPGLYDN
ncbi:hypothetical protein NMY22_g14405 [Coprinellus aureogranulatus]|nr:hypothetical protein NMY22_g14405 [Coprinellus aureogranulatus]